MNYALSRLAEPSSHASIAAAISVGAAWAGGQLGWQAALPALLFAIAGIFTAQKASAN